ncbi:HXXEE domain-containing protein [Lacrimispora xylanisolvens]|uniref:HXXEE domain-containing protein n=1 Tax=Lacrimispora xylanisolvens TaxID=384636 RepID=UPI0032E7F8FC
MNDIKVMVWLFPILFMFHDFEEIIFMQSWINKNRNYLTHRFPVLSKKLFSHFDQITTSAFSLGVAEEFIIISIITIVSYVTNWYILWIGLFITFALHLVIHCFQALVIRIGTVKPIDAAFNIQVLFLYSLGWIPTQDLKTLLK